METEELVGRLHSAVQRLEEAHSGLIGASPRALETCAGLMEQACRDLGGILPRPEGQPIPESALPTALRLRAAVRQARRLLDNAWGFHARWGQIVGVRTGGYLAGGQAAPLGGGGRHWWKG